MAGFYMKDKAGLKWVNLGILSYNDKLVKIRFSITGLYLLHVQKGYKVAK